MLAVPSNLIFSQNSVPFRFVPFRNSKWAIPRHTDFRERSTFFRGITKTIPSLSEEFFRKRNFNGNPTIRQLFFQFSKPFIFHSVCLFPANNFRSFHSKSTILGFYPKAKKSFVWNLKKNNLRRLLKRRRRSKVWRPWQKIFGLENIKKTTESFSLTFA